MVPYFILVILPVAVWMVSKKFRFTYGKTLVYETQAGSIDIFMLIFLLLVALRGLQVGNDTRQYLRLFNEYSVQSIPQLLTSYDHEFGYKLLNRMVGFWGFGYQALLGVTAALCVFPLWRFYKRESESQLLTIALFLTVAPFVMFFSGIRQGIAMSMGFMAWSCAREKKLIRFILVVLLAMQFHTSALVLFALYPLYYAKITPRWLWFVVPCMLVIFVFKTPVFHFLIRFLWDEYNLTEATGATSILVLLILFGIYSYVIPDEESLDQDTIAMRNLLLCSITIQFFVMLHPLAMRMNYYYLLFVPVLIPKIAKNSKTQYVQVADLSVVVMTAYFFYCFISNVIKDYDALNIFPYIPFWK